MLVAARIPRDSLLLRHPTPVLISIRRDEIVKIVDFLVAATLSEMCLPNVNDESEKEPGLTGMA